MPEPPAGQLFGAIDLPDGKTPVAIGPIAVRGWSLGAAGPASRVEISLNGRILGRAGLGRPRPDVAAAFGRPDGELAGFTFRLDLRRIEDLGETATLGAHVIFLDGTTVELPSVQIAIAPDPASAGLPPMAPVARAKARPSGERIRLLCLERSLARGGSQLRLSELLHHLRETGQFDCAVVAPVDGPLRGDLEAIGVEVGVAPMPIDDAASYRRELASLTAWAKDRFDVVLAFTLSSFIGIEVASLLGLPAVWRIGEIEPLATVVGWLGGRLDPLVELHAARALESASVVLFNSKSALDRYLERGARGQFAVLGSGIDVDGIDAYRRTISRAQGRERLGIAPDERVLVCAGTVWPVKGQALLVEALKELRAEHPELRCVLIGDQEAAYAEALSRFIESCGLGRNVRLLPFCEDPREWWQAADAAVCPSESESMSASLLEAMAFGLPVLTTNVGGAAEAIEDGLNGWLCEPNDLAAMIEGLRRAAKCSTSELEALGARATLVAAQRYNRTESTDRMTELLASLARGSIPAWASVKR